MALPAPSGQIPLTTDFSVPWGTGQFQGRGGGQEAAQYYAGQYFNKLFGRDPTESELAQYAPYFIGADPNIANVAGGDQAISSYFNQQQQAQQAPQQEAQAISQQIPIIQNLINSQTESTAKDLSNPASPTYQAFAGNMNNLGITPSSGAFQAGLGSTLGKSASEAINAALGSVGLPLASTYAMGATTPFTSAMETPGALFNNNLRMQDLLQQGILANQASQGSGLNALDYVNAAFNGIGNSAKAYAAVHGSGGGGGSGGGTSYVCMELIKRGLLCDQDLDDLHVHIMPALFKKARAFWYYAMNAKKLVDAANAKGLEWSHYKKWLFDDVMAEKDSSKAVDEYARGCEAIAMRCAPELWEPTVYWTGYLVSLPFIPLLFTYKPFREALWKCIRMKMLFLYDKPRCAHGT